MTDLDIRTRVELKNETQRESNQRGVAGKVALIGAFPSSKQRIFAAENYSQIVSHYGVTLGTTDVYWYSGVRTARRIFMEGIKGYGGASSITCINICKYKPKDFEVMDSQYKEVYTEDNEKYLYSDGTTDVSGNISIDGSNNIPTNTLQKDDVSLTFEKLERAFHQIADEDMDILFIANDLNEIFNYPLLDYNTPIYTAYTPKSGETPDTTSTDDYGNKLYIKTNNTYTKLTDYESITDEHGNTLYGKYLKNGVIRDIRNLGDVYDYILDFVDNEFTSHRPVNYVGAIKTQGTPEGSENNTNFQGIASSIIKINSSVNNPDLEEDITLLPPLYSELQELKSELESGKNSSTGETLTTAEKTQLTTAITRKQNEINAIEIYNPSESNPYANIKEWGALDIAKLFTRTTNELSTCGLFYQSGIIAGEEVDATELAAHMCGWICSLDISQDLTYQTIPGLTAVNEEPFLGANDAGTLLNQAGIQVIKPKNRLEKTFYVNNSIQPTGWHTNHIRSVTYLLKRLQFESGLGINNFITNIEAFRAILETVAKEVLDECEVIRSIEIGDIDVISSYQIFVPINIMLSGVITLINVGVSMTLDETGKATTSIKSTTGYSMTV